MKQRCFENRFHHRIPMPCVSAYHSDHVICSIYMYNHSVWKQPKSCSFEMISFVPVTSTSGSLWSQKHMMHGHAQLEKWTWSWLAMIWLCIYVYMYVCQGFNLNSLRNHWFGWSLCRHGAIIQNGGRYLARFYVFKRLYIMTLTKLQRR